MRLQDAPISFFRLLLWCNAMAIKAKSGTVPDCQVIPQPGGLLIKWDVQNDTVPPIVYYEIEVQSRGWSKTTKAYGRVSGAFIDQLEPCRFYLVVVTTVVNHKYDFRTDWKCGIPEPIGIAPVRRVRITNLDGGTQQIIKWKRPMAISSRCHLHYKVERLRRDKSKIVEWYTTEGPYLIDSSEQDTLNEYTIQAHYGDVRGQLWNAMITQTDAGRIPPTPYNLSADIQDRTVTLTWKMPVVTPEIGDNYLIFMNYNEITFADIGQRQFTWRNLDLCQFNIFQLSLNSAAGRRSGIAWETAVPSPQDIQRYQIVC